MHYLWTNFEFQRVGMLNTKAPRPPDLQCWPQRGPQSCSHQRGWSFGRKDHRHPPAHLALTPSASKIVTLEKYGNIYFFNMLNILKKMFKKRSSLSCLGRLASDWPDSLPSAAWHSKKHPLREGFEDGSDPSSLSDMFFLALGFLFFLLCLVVSPSKPD